MYRSLIEKGERFYEKYGAERKKRQIQTPKIPS